MSRLSRARESQTSLPSGTIAAVEQAYLSLYRTQRALIGMLLACAIFGLTLLKGASGSIGSKGYLPIILSTSLLTFAYTIRNAMVLPALAELRRNPRDGAALRRWQRNSLIVMALLAAVGLTGFALQLFGAALPIVFALYSIAIAYLFLLRPVRP